MEKLLTHPSNVIAAELMGPLTKGSFFKGQAGFSSEYKTTLPEAHAQCLSKREVEVIRLIIAGNTSCEIGERLFISEHTVRTHRKNILRKLNIHKTTQLIRYAFSSGLF
jgi:DNA-binding NarL/FixJ family response regulator